MKLIKVLDNTNTLEKNSFYKILESIIDNIQNEDVETILNDNNRLLKNIDNENISTVFEIIREDYKEKLLFSVENSLSQIDLLIDIIIRDGNCIMSREWLSQLYNKEIAIIQEKSKNFIQLLDEDSKELSPQKKRDYRIYRECLYTAYNNDELNNSDLKITHDEHTILKTLSNSLGLSTETVSLINYSIVPLIKLDVDSIIKELKEVGIGFYSRKSFTLYIPDEIIKILRDLRGKEVADKYFRRTLRQLKDSYINNVARVYNIDRKLTRKEKINEFVREGLNFTEFLTEDIFKPETLVSDKKKEINSLMESLEIAIKGTTIEDKINIIKEHFFNVENDERVGISIDGYERLLNDLNEHIADVNTLVRDEFELQQEMVLINTLLLDYNIKPRDVLELIDKERLVDFCIKIEIKQRGNLVQNILDNYTDSENLLIENYIHIGNRDLNELKNNGINIKTADFGVKYEDLTKILFTDLGVVVDDELKAVINTKKDKMDILLNLGNNELIIVECKTSKSKEFNKFSSVSRQIKSYHNLATEQGYRVVKTLLVAPSFSEEFIYDCELEYELNLSLITSEVLFNIWQGFKIAKHKVFPYNLLMRDVLIDDRKILKALKVN